jgi:hypothetical protein
MKVMNSEEENIKRLFPRLNYDHFKVTSEEDINYNCVAWAAMEDKTRFWQPFWGAPYRQYYWPAGVPRKLSMDAYKALFERLGYEVCSEATYEKDYEKVALFEKRGFFSHVAHQSKDGIWKSKLGDLQDIEHKLESLIGKTYGDIVMVMRKK